MRQRSDIGTIEETESSRTLKDLVRELRDETTDLFKQEVTLAKVELSEKASRMAKNSAAMAAGGMVAYAGLVLVLLGLSFLATFGLEAAGLGEAASIWLGPVLVGLVVAAIGYGMVAKGKKTLREESFVPEKSVESLKEDKDWSKRKVENL